MNPYMKTPKVSTWHVPTICQGQIIEHAYGISDQDGYGWERITDTSISPPNITYVLLGEPTEKWEPWNEVPTLENGSFI